MGRPVPAVALLALLALAATSQAARLPSFGALFDRGEEQEAARVAALVHKARAGSTYKNTAPIIGAPPPAPPADACLYLFAPSVPAGGSSCGAACCRALAPQHA